MEVRNPLNSPCPGADHGDSFIAMAGNPFFLIKARMQAYNPVLPVGTQHYYKHSWDALSSVWKAERWRGLIRGMDAAIIRTAMGSSVSASPVFLIERGYPTGGFAGTTA